VKNHITNDSWEAEYDSNTLAEAEAIKADSARHDRAKRAAAQKAQDLRKQADHMEDATKSSDTKGPVRESLDLNKVGG
jgi:hypothetical protein